LLSAFSIGLFEKIIHSSGPSQIDVSLSLVVEVLASVGKIRFKVFSTLVKNSLFLPLIFNFITG